MPELELRPWQKEANTKTLNWYISNKEKLFLLNGAPGCGKTIYAAYLAKNLKELDFIDRVIVIAPTKEVVRKWSEEFEFVTKLPMTKVTSADENIEGYGIDLCATWQAVEGLSDAFQKVCNSSRTLVICDEHHHASVAASWGQGANGAFKSAKYVLILTGTPLRSDGNESVWLAHDVRGKIKHPEQGTFTLSYGDAVDFGYCRSITFHRHKGELDVTQGDDTIATVSSDSGSDIKGNVKKINGIDTALEFYNLACKVPYNEDGSENYNSYQRSMLIEAIKALENTQQRMPNAGGLVISPSIEVAEYMVRLLEKLTNKKPILVHSKLRNSSERIRTFRNSNHDWIVSVNMISEGVDLPRLRVLVYLPYAQTELSFRQAMGRVVRNYKINDDTRAYVVMPNTQVFDEYASRVEDEMGPKYKNIESINKTKICPICDKENELSAKVCECGYDFPKRKTNFKPCLDDNCNQLNPIQAKECQSCGTSFENRFSISLKDALRQGVIARGMQLTEEETKESEKIAEKIRSDILATGDDRIIKTFSCYPDESFVRICKVLSQYYKKTYDK
mgnify:CR=1 FL=1